VPSADSIASVRVASASSMDSEISPLTTEKCLECVDAASARKEVMARENGDTTNASVDAIDKAAARA
jgi:hypothetical protein